MTLRTNIDARKRLAHELLDQVRAGISVPLYKVRWCLIVLGDGIE